MRTRKNFGPKPIRYNAAAATPLLQAAAKGTREQEDQRTIRKASMTDTNTTPADGTAPDTAAVSDAKETAADDLSDVTAADYAAAAETMAQQAAGGPDGTTTDCDSDGDESDDTGEPEPSWRDAFSPESEDEPEAAGRDGRYRRSLKEAAATNERLSRALADMQTAEVHRIAADRLADPSDLFIGAKLADMLDADQRIDRDRVNAAVDNVLAAKPHYQRPMARYTGELRSGASERPMEKSAPSWRDAFSPQAELPVD
jgi:hypothetical protein